MKLKTAVRSLLPTTLRNWVHKRINANNPAYFERKSVSETFTEIYRNNIWGGENGTFYSGEGSDANVASVYVHAINRILEEIRPQIVVDIGCGDFRVASQFVNPGFRYIGLDVVPDLVENHKMRYQSEYIDFQLIDATSEELPDGDICLIRQVLQHLSNDEISRILNNCRKFRYLVITEHFPPPGVPFVPNQDMPHGADIRIGLNSAVCVDQSPFNLADGVEIASVTVGDGSVIRTFLFEQHL